MNITTINISESITGFESKCRLKKMNIVENQWRYHIDTLQLYKNIHKITKNSIIHISQKTHGSSVISGKILVERKLSFFEKVLKFFNVRS